MEKVLMLTDFSANAKCAVYYGLSLLKGTNCKIIFVHTTYLPYARPNSEAAPTDVRTENARDCFAELLTCIRKDFEGEIFDVETRIINGSVETVATKIAKEEAINLVVMGAHGSTLLQDVLLGRNTIAIVENLRTAVLVVPAGFEFTDPDSLVLAMDDGSGPRKPVLQPMIDIAEKFSSQVLVVHVSRNEESEKDLKHENVRKALDSVRSHYITIHDEDIVNGLGGFIKSERVDIFCIVKQRLSFFERVFHKSLSNQMVLQTEVPMLIMSHKK